MLRMLSLTAFILAAGPALAQNPQTAAPADPTVPTAPPNAPSPPPEKIAPPAGNATPGRSAAGNPSARSAPGNPSARSAPGNPSAGQSTTRKSTGDATTGDPTGGTAKGGDLSTRLSQQRGMIAPPNVDSGMTVAPPATGRSTTPVIPPPGSPGGNRSVVPK